MNGCIDCQLGSRMSPATRLDAGRIATRFEDT